MLKHPTLDGLQTLKLSGMVAALADQMATPDIDELAFEERLGLLVDREITERENRRLTSRLRRARLRHAAALEDIDYRNPRGLDNWRPASGQRSTSTSSSSDPPVWAKPGWPAPSHTRPAARVTRSSTCA